jgi:cytochrome c
MAEAGDNEASDGRPGRVEARRAGSLAFAAIDLLALGLLAVGLLAFGLLALDLLAFGDAARADDLPGAELFTSQCGTCHVISPTPEQRQGPNLYCVIGRPAGKLKGFKYSPAMAKAKFTWTNEKVDSWLTDSGRLVPGSVMPYRQEDATIRAKIIDYIAAAGGMAKAQ